MLRRVDELSDGVRAPVGAGVHRDELLPPPELPPHGVVAWPRGEALDVRAVRDEEDLAVLCESSLAARSSRKAGVSTFTRSALAHAHFSSA